MMGQICPHHGGPALAEISLSAVAVMFCSIPGYIQTFIRINVAAREYPSAVGGVVGPSLHPSSGSGCNALCLLSPVQPSRMP